MSNFLVWFRQDLRISDNPALSYAIENGEKVAAIYIHDEVSENVRKIGSASKWWLHYALSDLSKNLKEKYGIDLIIAEGKSEEILNEIDSEYIVWNRLYEPYYIDRDTKIKTALEEKNIVTKSFNGSLIAEPWEIKNGSGEFYKVFTSFYKKCSAEHKPREVLKEPKGNPESLKLNINSLKIEDLNLLPTKPDWSGVMQEEWQVSEKAAQDSLYDFMDNKAENYKEGRDFPIGEYTSKLSPYLHFGQISPNQILSVCEFYESKFPEKKAGAEKFISEVFWREFSYHLLYHTPIHEKNFRPEFDNFEWVEDGDSLKKWQKGKTGYPIVDAGMRELWATGWMHNRVRMIVGSFLTKDLLIHWKEGEKWFWDTLLDADLANNSASWQWVAGSGADASPYFRIFNPVTQGTKFDGKGEYVRKWIPELKDLPDEFIHSPWEADEEVLKQANVELGKTYPKPMVNHKLAREQALKIYGKIKKG